MTIAKIRQPIVTICGHVDHGKTSILDALRDSSVQSEEAGGITQKISFTKFPLEQVHKICPLIKKNKIEIKIPGFLFIDTPGHAAFTNLRKRGGSLADMAILVVDIKEGIKPQTAEVLSILKHNKTPFIIALNKIDTISGWKNGEDIEKSIKSQATYVKEEFETALLTFQGSLQSHGFDSALFYEINDFTKKIALIPCCAKTKQGISELLFVLSGLCQKFLTKQLTLGKEAKGVILEIKKDKSMENVEAILYDGNIKENDEIVIANFDERPLISKIIAIEEIQPLSFKYKKVKEVNAATGIRIRLTDKKNLLPGMPFQKLNNNLNEISTQFKKEISQTIKTDNRGIIIKADSLGSLEAMITLLKQSNIQILKASVGNITKYDIISAKANLDINPLDAVVLGFNVRVEENIDLGNVKVIINDVVYHLIEDLEKWRKEKQIEIEKIQLMGLATICKLQILPGCVFRNSNPAIFGVRVLVGTLKTHIPLIDENDNNVAHIKSMQIEKHTVQEAMEGTELAISLPGVNFERQLKNLGALYSNLSESQYKKFKENKEILSANELKVLNEIAQIKRKKNEKWGET